MSRYCGSEREAVCGEGPELARDAPNEIDLLCWKE
jgi:hypothetical protein